MAGDAVESSPAGVMGTDWWAARWRVRLVRRVALSTAGPLVRPVLRRWRPDLADGVDEWAAVRAAVSREAWDRITGTSYSVLCYHRLAGEGIEGQERIDVPPQRFAVHLRTLRRLGFVPLSRAEVLAVHGSGRATLGRRRFLLTADDGFADCVAALRRFNVDHAWMFVPTMAPGGVADWAHGSLVASWDDLVGLAGGGVTIGSHGRTHTPLTELTPAQLDDELAGSREDLRARGLDSSAIAYPNGRHDDAVCSAARAAGFDLGFSTEPGRNGPDSDAMRLRRVTPKSWDSRTSLVFKVVTGEPLPARWEARRRARHDRRRHRRAHLRARTENVAPARRYRLQLAARAADAAVGSKTVVRVLDAGCQEGLLARHIARSRPHWEVVGVDLDPAAVRRAAQRAADADLTNVTFVTGDLTRDLSLGRFDVVAAMECLAEIPDDTAAVRSMAGALAPGGRLLLHVPEAEWRPVLRGSALEWANEVRHGYRPDELRRMIEAAGLEVIRISRTTHTLVHAAQELRDRFVRGRGVKARLLALPVMAAAVRLERMGLVMGPARALFVEARKP